MVMRSVFLLLAFLLPLYSGVKKERSGPFGSFITPPDAPTIVLDPGHGGTDRGARAKAPFCEEKRVSLLTARLVKKYLDQLGYHVVMTRNTDDFIPLSRRVEIASQAGSAAFVSIHYNASRNADAQGIEIFFYDSKEHRSRSTASKKLADAILPRLIRRTQSPSRGVKKGNFYVTRETSMPAILIEGGFISNPKERTLLKNREYQEKLSRGIADGIDQYFKSRWHAAAFKPKTKAKDNAVAMRKY